MYLLHILIQAIPTKRSGVEIRWTVLAIANSSTQKSPAHFPDLQQWTAMPLSPEGNREAGERHGKKISPGRATNPTIHRRQRRKRRW
jgi:hypothetical protein